MSKVDTILNQLKDIAANPKKAMDDYKTKQEKALSVLCLYTLLKNLYMPQDIFPWEFGAEARLFQKHVHIFLHLPVL